MSRIQIVTDSTCDLSEELRRQYGIDVVPLHVVFGDRDYKDGADMRAEQLFELVSASGKLPKTAAPSPGEFLAAFEPYIEQGCDIVYVGLSSKLSATYNNACLAAEQLPPGRIVCVDSLNLATGVGLLALKAAKAAHAGASLADIERLLLEARERVETEFVIDTLDYLHKGGRCSALQSFIGGLLKIRPVIKVAHGSITVAAKIRGKREKALEQLVANLLERKERIEDRFVFVEHALAPEDAAELKRQLEDEHGLRVELAEAGCVISSHCGPQTVGIIYTLLP
ncbi:DegV [Gordoniibacillus kamchatkensis]|uniref:DegV n=1 Tax=Gordoniibacillus kamchatkensis TaxID=1590651 RepID=A0ABR5AFV8_9BACL|nr:DegV family protein [Paenibacillus sp. VKM B-2647]KIL39941.1 DegV [Paenibacillus sp. VKM B-2647]